MEYIFHICRSVQLLQPTPVRVPEGRRQAWQPAVPFIFLLSVQFTPAWLQVKNWAQNFSLKIIRLKSGVFSMSWHHVRSSRRVNTCELAELTRVNSNTSNFLVSDQVWRKSTKVLGSEKPDVDKDVRWVGTFICWDFFPLSFTYLPSRPRRLSVTPEPRSGLFAYFKRPTKNYDLIAQSLVLYLQSKEKKASLAQL